MASDPMALRRGGKKFAMEDVCYYQWPLPGVDQVLVLAICVFFFLLITSCMPKQLTLHGCLSGSLDSLVSAMGIVE